MKNKIIAYLFFVIFIISSSAFSKETTQMNQKKISFNDQGQGKALVLIHAFPTDQRLWQKQQEKLQQYFRVITVDLWGFGNSAATDGKAVTMEEYADEINQLLDQLHIQNAIIGGESMGGYISLAFLEKYPDKVSGLILSNTQAIADSPESKIKREETAEDVLAHGTQKLIENFLPKALSPNASETQKNFLKTMMQAQSATGIASALRGMSLRPDRSSVLSDTQLPILILSSDLDSIIPATQSEKMHELAKNSELVVIKNAGHLASLEKPDEWNAAVIEKFH